MDNVYVNIGSTKCCLFVKTSLQIMRQLERNPFLYYAVEEGMECAKNGYYAAGILAFSQLLNAINETTPKDRHLVAHQILKQKPTKEMYETIKTRFENATSAINAKEISRHKNMTEYKNKINQRWNEVMANFNPDWKDLPVERYDHI